MRRDFTYIDGAELQAKVFILEFNDCWVEVPTGCFLGISTFSQLAWLEI